MQWDVTLGRAVVYTLLISGGAGILATALAATLAILVFTFRIVAWRACAAILGSVLLIPLYVQATAWSAGFGTQGWLRLSQVDAAKYPAWGLASVLWIHAVAALPVCFLILSVGLHRIRDATYEQAWSEFGPWYVLRQIIPRRIMPWLGAAFLWVACTTQNDMVVTNLFQVPTLCESVYQQVQFGKLRGGPIAAAIVLAMSIGVLIAWLVARSSAWSNRFDSESPQGGSRFQPIAAWNMTTRLGATILGWGIVGVTVLLPLASLAVRIGWESRMIDGVMTRSWSLAESARSLRHVADYSTEIGWSLSLSFWSALLAVCIALIIVAATRSNPRVPVAAIGMGFLLALPGPIVNLAVLWLLDSGLPEILSFLSDRTLVGPILALQCRCLPIAYGILWITKRKYGSQHYGVLALEKDLPLWVRQWVWMRYAWAAIATSALVAFFVAFGDLSTYLLVQPPGVTTVAMRLFDLLHYGIRNREASLALVLAAFAAAPSFWLTWRIHQTR